MMRSRVYGMVAAAVLIACATSPALAKNGNGNQKASAVLAPVQQKHAAKQEAKAERQAAKQQQHAVAKQQHAAAKQQHAVAKQQRQAAKVQRQAAKQQRHAAKTQAKAAPVATPSAPSAPAAARPTTRGTSSAPARIRTLADRRRAAVRRRAIHRAALRRRAAARRRAARRTAAVPAPVLAVAQAGTSVPASTPSVPAAAAGPQNGHAPKKAAPHKSAPGASTAHDRSAVS